MKRLILAFVISVLTVFSAQAATYVAGQDYLAYPQAKPTSDASKVEVREFFSYACPHCFRFRPYMDAWMEKQGENVKLVRVPVVFHPSWEPLAKAYYAAEILGVLDKSHAALFDAIHVNKSIKLRSNDVEDQLAAFFEQYGVSKEQFKNTMNSFVVDGKLRKGKTELRDFQVSSTPTVIVNGKYLVNAKQAKTHEGMALVTDALVQQELANLKK